MHIDEIRGALHRQPFRPFVMQLVDGTVRHVPHPDFVALGRRRVVAIDASTDATSFIEPLHVVSIEYTQTPASSLPATGDRNGESQ
jgi:hypothetical protein